MSNSVSTLSIFALTIGFIGFVLRRQVLKRKHKLYEAPISYYGRDFSEGKKITWRDGFAAVWALIKRRFLDRIDWMINFESGGLT